MSDLNKTAGRMKDLFGFTAIFSGSIALFFFILSVAAFISSDDHEFENAIRLPNIVVDSPDASGEIDRDKSRNLYWVRFAMKSIEEKVRDCYASSLEQDPSISSHLLIRIVLTRFGKMVVFGAIEVPNTPSLFFGPCLEREIAESPMVELDETISQKTKSVGAQTRVSQELRAIVQDGKVLFQRENKETGHSGVF